MEAHATHDEGTIGRKGKSEVNDRETWEMKRCAERIWNAVSRYVTFDDDAIFKDPNWPYMWKKK